jgi:hypothetical protein
MFLGAHFAVPAISVIAYEYLVSKKKTEVPKVNTSSLAIIGSVGLIPDMFYPHLGGGSHLHSNSHSIWAMFLFLGAITLLYYALSVKKETKLLIFLLFSLISHYILDFISGGIKWMYPFSEQVIGVRLIPFGAYVMADFVLLSIFFLLVFFIKRTHYKKTI